MNDVREVSHPAWCDRTLCDTPGHFYHYSASMALGEDADGVATSLRLIQSAPRKEDPNRGTPIVELTLSTPRFDETDTGEDDHLVVLSMERALALGYQLTAIARTALGGQPGPGGHPVPASVPEDPDPRGTESRPVDVHEDVV